MTKRFLFFFTVVSLCCMSFLWAAPKTDVYIGITSTGKQKLPAIGMPAFTAIDEQSQSAATQVHDVMRADLLFARYFDVTEDGPAFDTDKVKSSLTAWAKLPSKPSYVLTGTISYAEPYYTIKVYVYDISTRTPVFAKAFKGTQTSLRRLAHIASDQIVSALIGKRGIADTKIAFANNATRHKEIYVVDYDGQNLQKLTKDNSISLLPRWSKDGRIFYTSYKYRNPDIFAIDLRAGKISPIIIKKGLSLIGGVSPDGKALVFTSSGGTNPSIYIYNLETQQKVQITNKTTAAQRKSQFSFM